MYVLRENGYDAGFFLKWNSTNQVIDDYSNEVRIVMYRFDNSTEKELQHQVYFMGA